MVCLLRWALYGGLVTSVANAKLAPFATRLPRPQAIGIDFGPEVITVAYAYSNDNVTLPAFVKPEPGDPFSTYLFAMRLDPWKDGTLDALYGGKKGTFDIFNPVVDLFGRLASSFTYCSHDTADLSWVRQYVCGAWHGIKALIRSAKGPQLREFTLDDVKDAVVDILTRLQEQALTEHDIDIQSAIIAIPEFLNQTLADLFLEASQEAGITPLGNSAMGRMVMSTYSNEGTPREADGKYLMMDQGKFYLDLQSLNVIPDRTGRLPLDPWGTAALDREITRLAIDRSEILKVWLSLGGSKSDLQEEVRRARMLIRDNLDLEMLGTEGNQDHHHDEYPLELKDPYMTDVLSWDDVKSGEMTYVESLARNINTYLVSASNPPSPIQDYMATTKIDKAFILECGLDGSLIKQSLEQALGEVEIIGGRLQDWYLAAEGAAQFALEYQQAWDKIIERGTCDFEKDEL